MIIFNHVYQEPDGSKKLHTPASNSTSGQFEQTMSIWTMLTQLCPNTLFFGSGEPQVAAGEELELIVAVFNYAGAGTLTAQLEVWGQARKKLQTSGKEQEKTGKSMAKGLWIWF